LHQDFFIEANRILVSGGMFTIVTDNLWYGRLLLRIIGSLKSDDDEFGLSSYKHKKKSKNISISNDWIIKEEELGISLFVGIPGIEAGHVVQASSYFDRYKNKFFENILFIIFCRLWKRSNLSERFFIVLKKRDESKMINSKLSESDVIDGEDKKQKSNKKKKRKLEEDS
jgi:hypothetical protein